MPTHRRTLAALFAALLMLLAPPASLAADATDDSLYQAFGGKAGLATLMDDFVGRLKADATIGGQFKDVSAKHLSKQLTDQLCQVAGGPCTYEGETMKRSHAGLGVTRRDFNRLVEVLQDTMDARGIPFGVQNRMLARLAPMHRDIVLSPAAAPASR